MVHNLKIGSKAKHKISPYLYMQFMEPLGVCDSSVDAAWDFVENDWYQKVIDKVNELAPTMVRFGGCFASYYHWKEAVGPMKDRVPMINYLWGGVYMNQVGTHEFMDFCRRVNAEPLMVVNMESDGRPIWSHPKNGTNRFGTAKEAAEWVAYCNDPDDRLRLSHGVKDPYNLKYWQVGNETSYFDDGYTVQNCADATTRFVKEMRAVDPSIKIIAWADRHKYNKELWAPVMNQVEGVDMLAFHHHFNSGLPNDPLRNNDWRKDFDYTWQHLMNAHKSMQEHMDEMRAIRGDKRLAMTECHFSLPGRNRNEVMSTWGTGVAYARCHNTIMRNSDILDIATMADFFGNVWQCNAIILPPPLHMDEKKPYLQPVATIMALFGRHQGEEALDVSSDAAIDVVASRTGKTVYLHIANTDMHTPQQLKVDLDGAAIQNITMEYIAADPETEVMMTCPDVFASTTVSVEGDTITIPAAGVAAVEITLA